MDPKKLVHKTTFSDQLPYISNLEEPEVQT